MNKNKMYSLIICSITLLVLIIGASYAYFGSKTSLSNEVKITATEPSTVPTFTATSTDAMVLQGDVGINPNPTVPNLSATGNLTVTFLAYNTSSSFKCTYDLIYVWDSDVYYQGTDRGSDNKFYEGYDYELSLVGSLNGTEEIAEINLDELPSINGDSTWLVNSSDKKYAYIKKNMTITSETLGTKVTQKWEFKINLYSIPISQKELYSKKYSSHIEVTNVKC